MMILVERCIVAFAIVTESGPVFIIKESHSSFRLIEIPARNLIRLRASAFLCCLCMLLRHRQCAASRAGLRRGGDRVGWLTGVGFTAATAEVALGRYTEKAWVSIIGRRMGTNTSVPLTRLLSAHPAFLAPGFT